MPAIITDQFRILNAETFSKSMTGIGTTSNYYYTFLGHPNPTDVRVEEYGSATWSTDPPEPLDSFQQEDRYHDSMLFLKRIGANDVARVVTRQNWTAGTVYDMYKHDYDINNKSPQQGASTLYESRYYVVNSEFKVYVCINNGALMFFYLTNKKKWIGQQSEDIIGYEHKEWTDPIQRFKNISDFVFDVINQTYLP